MTQPFYLTVTAAGVVRNSKGELLDADGNVTTEEVPVTFTGRVPISADQAAQLGHNEGESS
jgi:hypothetical protein